jgi:hypothetical protein
MTAASGCSAQPHGRRPVVATARVRALSLVWVLAASLAASLAACGAPGERPAPPAPTGPASPGTGAEGPASGPARLLVEAEDGRFRSVPEAAGGLTEVVLRNAGTTEHEAKLYQLAPGKAFEDFASVAADVGAGGPLPDWVVPAGGPGPVPPGGSAGAMVDLRPGYYVILCALPGPDGTPHFQHGQLRPLRVAPTPPPR